MCRCAITGPRNLYAESIVQRSPGSRSAPWVDTKRDNSLHRRRCTIRSVASRADCGTPLGFGGISGHKPKVRCATLGWVMQPRCGKHGNYGALRRARPARKSRCRWLAQRSFTIAATRRHSQNCPPRCRGLAPRSFTLQERTRLPLRRLRRRKRRRLGWGRQVAASVTIRRASLRHLAGSAIRLAASSPKVSLVPPSGTHRHRAWSRRRARRWFAKSDPA